MARINFTNNINVSAQVGDILFHHVGASDAGTALGVITSVGPNFIEIDDANVGTAVAADFLSVKKSSDINYYANSSVKGYYAKIKLSNSQSAKQELFNLGSEITESSK